jgi:hypothetical protein
VVTALAAPYLAATRPHRDAADLLQRFGEEAGGVARARAAESRRLGNHIHFCRWREVERLIEALGEGRSGQTLH